MKIQITQETIEKAREFYNNDEEGCHYPIYSHCPTALTLKNLFNEKDVEVGFVIARVGKKQFNLSEDLKREVNNFTMEVIFTPGEYELTERV